MEKKGFLVILSMAFCFFIYGCNSEKPDTEYRESFIGEIVEINNSEAVISITEGKILSSGSRVNVDLSVNSAETFQVGDFIKVIYDGTVRESDPLQINTIEVEKIND